MEVAGVLCRKVDYEVNLSQLARRFL